MTALGVDGPNIQDREFILLKVVGVLDVGGCGAREGQKTLVRVPSTLQTF